MTPPPPATTPIAAEQAGRLPTGGSALHLDGKSSYVEVPWKYDGTHPLTVEAWTIAERPADEPDPECLFGDMEVAGWGLMRIKVPNDPERKLRFYLHDGAYHRIPALQMLPAGQPEHVAAVYDGQEARLYVDGKLQAKEPIAGPVTRSPMPTLIGGNPNVGALAGIDALWQGTIDEVRFSKVAATPRLCRRHNEPDAETVVLYHFDESRGGEARCVGQQPPRQAARRRMVWLHRHRSTWLSRRAIRPPDQPWPCSGAGWWRFRRSRIKAARSRWRPGSGTRCRR
jgi:hypothetical protein